MKTTSSNLKNTILKYSQWLWFALIVALALRFGLNYHTQIIHILSELKWGDIFLSAFCLILAKVALGKAAQEALAEVGIQWSWLKSYYMYSMADLAKYLPGGVWGIVGRYALYRQEGLDNKQSVSAMALENAWLIGFAFLSGAIFCLPYLPVLSMSLFQWVLPGFFPFVLFPVLLGLCFLLIDSSARVFNGKKTSLSVHLRVFGTQWFVSFVIGLSQWVLFHRWMPIGLVLLGVGAFALARGLGYVSFFAPAGIGVREWVFLILVAPFIPQQEILVLIALYRVITAGVEFIVFPPLFLIYRHFENRGPKKGPEVPLEC